MSLLCRLKNLVHKGILKEKDLDRIVIIPKEQEPCEDCISRAEALKNLALTNGKDDVYRMINSLPSIQPKSIEGGGDCISREKVCDYLIEFVNHEYATDREREMVANMIDGIKYMPSI